MTPQPWLAITFAAIMIATAGYCLSRLALSWRQNRPTDRTVDAAHVVMGVAMAGMLVPRLQVIPPAGGETLFAVGAALFGGRLIWRRRARRTRGQHRHLHDVQHLLGCGAMLYMLATMAPRASEQGALASHVAMAVGGLPGLALVLAVALLGCVVWSADRISALAPVAVLAGGATRSTVPLSPRLAACCEIAMGVTMGYMLIVLL